jgi:hypothetical protein
VSQWGKAGQRSVARSALVEARSNSPVPSTGLRPCQPLRRCVARRSSFKWRS